MNNQIQNVTAEHATYALKRATLYCFFECHERGYFNHYEIKYIIEREGEMCETSQIPVQEELLGIHILIEQNREVLVFCDDYSDVIQVTGKPVVTLFYLATILLAKEILDFNYIEIFDDNKNVLWTLPREEVIQDLFNKENRNGKL